MRWLELTVQAHPEAVESVSELLSRYTPGGVAIEEPFELVDEGQEYRVLAGEPVKVHAYLPIDGKEEEARQRVAEGLWHLSSLGPQFVGDLQTRVVNEEDWANAWKDYYHVTHIGRRLVIRPSWRDYTPKDDEVVLELDPGMAFGTGLHPTTRMCLEQVEQRVQPRMQGQYDIVLANIIARVIGSIAPHLAQVLAPRGLLIASGIIEERRHEAEQPLLDAGLKLVEATMIDDWVTLVMTK